MQNKCFQISENIQLKYKSLFEIKVENDAKSIIKMGLEKIKSAKTNDELNQ